MYWRWLLLLAALGAVRCSGESPSPSPVPIPSSPAVLVGAGDIADCRVSGSEATARLLDRIQGTVFTAGDNAYPSGTPEEFRNCYHPSWGRHISRTRPTPGNHDYGYPGAMGYFEYFGSAAGPPGVGFYSYNAGTWHVVVLNSEISMQTGSAQVEWLRSELQNSGRRCVLAIWHRPLFSSGEEGDNPDTRQLWRTLYEFGAEIVVTGHDHSYERFAPQDPDGRPDSARGLRQFVVGTGGAPVRSFIALRPNSEVRGSVWGVLVLTLEDGSYRWEFRPVDGATFRDSGSGACH
jgi:calcineurin-like phosphoesterase family protein